MDMSSLVVMATSVIASWAPRVLGAVAVLGFGWFLAGWAKKLATGGLKRAEVDEILVPFIAGLAHVLLLVLIAIAAVSTLGVSTTSFVAVLGAAGLAVALAFQDTFSNFAAGVMILTFRPFNVGDIVEVGGVAGTVRGVRIFTCVLSTPDNIQIEIPNSQIFGATIKNFSANETRRIDLVIGVSYDDDLGLVVRTCMDVVASDPRVLQEPETVVAVSELADSSVNLVVRPWVDTSDYWHVRWDLTRALKENLEAAGCSIPFPQRDVHLHQAT